MMLGECFGKCKTTFHISLDVENQFLDLEFTVAVSDHVQSLHHSNARTQHGAQLPSKQHDILGSNLVPEGK